MEYTVSEAQPPEERDPEAELPLRAELVDMARVRIRFAASVLLDVVMLASSRSWPDSSGSERISSSTA